MKNLKIKQKVKKHLIKKGFIVFEKKGDKFVDFVAIKNLMTVNGEKFKVPTVIFSSSSLSLQKIKQIPIFAMLGISLSKFNKKNEKKAIKLLEKNLYSDFYFVKLEKNKILFGHLNYYPLSQNHPQNQNPNYV